MFHSAGAWLKPNVFPGILSKLLAANAVSVACNLQQFFCKGWQPLQFFLKPTEKNRGQAIGSPKSHLCALLLVFEGFFRSVFQLYNLPMQGHPNRKGKKSWIFSLALSYFLTRACLAGLNIGTNAFPDQNGVSYRRWIHSWWTLPQKQNLPSSDHASKNHFSFGGVYWKETRKVLNYPRPQVLNETWDHSNNLFFLFPKKGFSHFLARWEPGYLSAR